MIEIVTGGEPADTHGIFSSLHGERLTLAELRGFFLVQDGGVARQDVQIASIVIVVEAEGALAVSLNCEVAACHAEIIVVGGIHVEGSRALAEDQTCGARAII